MIRHDGSGEPGGYEAELGNLELRAETLRQALGASNTERRLCSKKHSARIAPGIYAYNGLITSLSRQLEDESWERVNLSGVLPVMLNPRKRVALGVTSGNALTGLRLGGQQPSSRYPKGELTRKLVSKNVSPGQIELLGRSAFLTETTTDQLAGYNLWLMVVYFDPERKQIRHEVSLPERLTAKGYVKDWYDRITPPQPYSVDDEGFDIDGDDPNEGFGPPDVVPVEPR
ncbi:MULTISPECIES: hypothetical protein [unclassified Streptomyces]|uniref:hypothetical protein n=1 Tax=unclassified Streptomyces TaxID=2593676 RepID=UPI0008049675|nr:MULTISPECIES: hypothetical protein [unclassified Streptomyces]MYR74556.1 hypothetical protein [Streptomyces sp. SID4925]SBU89907.1 hypothetical protein YUMDRAFT_00768 [Streptomyces sp. OspMP-M45]